MNPDDFKWILMDPNGSEWIPMDPNEFQSKWIQIDSQRILMGFVGS